MRIDLYTKTILTLIALLLAVIVVKPILQPQSAMAEGPYGASNSRIAGGTTRSSIPAAATFGNMATRATLTSTTKSMNLVRIMIAITTVKMEWGREPRRPARNCPMHGASTASALLRTITTLAVSPRLV